MIVSGRSGKKWVGSCEHFQFVHCNILNSELIVPKPASNRQHPPGPVELIIRIHYSLNFADSQNGTLRPLVMVKINDTCYVQDANWDWFEVSDWNFASSTEFAHRFKRGQDFWDRKFMLLPADSCTDFDYDLIINDKVERWRPNILCRFELVGGPLNSFINSEDSAPVHLELDVIRSERPFVDRGMRFRSDSGLYDARHIERDARVLWHELGHAMDQDHIQALAFEQIYQHPVPELDRNQVQALANGRNTCSNDDDENGEVRCYVTPPWFAEENVMGKGKGLALENAKSWRELINEHLIGQPRDFTVSMSTARPPRLISVRPNDPTPPPQNRPGPGFLG